MKILLVEDEIALADSIVAYLRGAGHTCEAVHNYADGTEKIAVGSYDCLVVDITLPDGTGLNLIRLMKKLNPGVGIIVISAKNSVEQRIEGLEIGADDYLPKPFHLTELNARINSLLRRIYFQGNNSIILNEITVKPDELSVLVNDKELDLTKKEFDLLMFFISNKNKVITKSSISEHLWGDYSENSDSFDFIYTHIKNLKKKLVAAGAQDYIQNVYGVGYKFEV